MGLVWALPARCAACHEQRDPRAGGHRLLGQGIAVSMPLVSQRHRNDALGILLETSAGLPGRGLLPGPHYQVCSFTLLRWLRPVPRYAQLSNVRPAMTAGPAGAGVVAGFKTATTNPLSEPSDS
jgi:hypothetical protein